MIRIEAGDMKFEDGWKDDLLRQAAEQQLEPMRRGLAGLRCPTHGETATVKSREKPEKPGWKIYACCDQLREQAEERLVSAGFAERTAD
jgi:hypothetical protein